MTLLPAVGAFAKIGNVPVEQEDWASTGRGVCRCGVQWTGHNVCHCAACHLTFTSVGPFDWHRRAHGCLTTTDLLAKGYEPNEANQWRKPAPAGAFDAVPPKDL